MFQKIEGWDQDLYINDASRFLQNSDIVRSYTEGSSSFQDNLGNVYTLLSCEIENVFNQECIFFLETTQVPIYDIKSFIKGVGIEFFSKNFVKFYNDERIFKLLPSH